MYILTLTTQPHQKIRFLEIFFRILNMFAIKSNLQKKILIFAETPRNNFLNPQFGGPKSLGAPNYKPQ
jgi:hypothetical protein